MPDRHKEKPLSLRLGTERQRVEEAAATAGKRVRAWLLEAVREKLDRESGPADRGQGTEGGSVKISYTIEGPAVGIHPICDTIDIPDEELAGLGDKEREKLIQNYVQAEVENHVQWGWEIADV